MAGKGCLKVDRDCYDNEKLWEFIKESEIDTRDIAKLCGCTEDTVLRYLNKINSITLAEPTLRMIIAMAGGKYEDFVYDKPIKVTSPVETVAEPREIKVDIDLSEISEKLDNIIVALEKLVDVETAINKLGNVEMQNLEYTKSIMDDVNSSNSELKKLNDKWNKPGAYRK